jgi:cysteine synthase A
MIDCALDSGQINKNTTIIEPTSGNTGIGLAMVCASYGMKLILTMPDSMSLERRALLSGFGAKLVLTDSKLGMNGAIQKANELKNSIENSYVLQQFNNPNNPKIHELTTAKEIWRDTNGKVDIFIAAVGTGGTITGIGKELKKRNPDIKIYAVEPYLSAVLSGEKAGFHKIQGIGAGFVPEILDTDIYDNVIKVSYEDSLDMARELARTEGLLVGISAGANVLAAQQIANEVKNQDKTIVTILCDTGERYLSSGIYRQAR